MLYNQTYLFLFSLTGGFNKYNNNNNNNNYYYYYKGAFRARYIQKLVGIIDKKYATLQLYSKPIKKNKLELFQVPVQKIIDSLYYLNIMINLCRKLKGLLKTMF